MVVEYESSDSFASARGSPSLMDHGMPSGWPLGLGNLSLRLRVRESQQPAAPEPYSSHAHSSSFSSLSSSNLDTEVNQSTASFFQDHSVTFGRLIGIRPRDRELLHFPNSNRIEQHETISERISLTDEPRCRVEEMSRGICVPLLVSILMKMTRNRSNSSR